MRAPWLLLGVIFSSLANVVTADWKSGGCKGGCEFTYWSEQAHRLVCKHKCNEKALDRANARLQNAATPKAQAAAQLRLTKEANRHYMTQERLKKEVKWVTPEGIVKTHEEKMKEWEARKQRQQQAKKPNHPPKGPKL